MSAGVTLVSARGQALARRLRSVGSWSPGTIMLAVGVVALVLPTLYDIARIEWATEQGSFGPIVFGVAIWLFVRRRRAVAAAAAPGRGWVAAIALVPALALYVVARTTGFIVEESIAGYGALIAVGYLFVGAGGLRAVRFPLAFFLFALPIAAHVFAPVSQPLRLLIGDWAIAALAAFGYQVGQDGLTLFIDQYALTVREACSGFSSIVSLGAIGLFHVYMRRGPVWWLMIAVTPLLIGLALAANFARVLLLLLITHYGGDALAQGFLHGLSGMVMFAVALGGFFLIDAGLGVALPVSARRDG